jgi:hypothetical protein
VGAEGLLGANQPAVQTKTNPGQGNNAQQRKPNGENIHRCLCINASTQN